MRIIKKYGKKLLYKELRKSYNFFIKEANTNKKSKGYGLIKDKTILANNISSIASVGYCLAALVIGVEHNWIKYKKAYDRANRTLETFINNVEGKNGFYYHFVNMQTGKREWNCEISIIDTAIFICGAIYQYSHAWIDFRNLTDINRVNWFENSIKATKANIEYCIDNKNKFKTYGVNSWGLTACLSPKGYIGPGAEPCDVNLEIENDGTISPCGAIGSIVFTPKESIKAMEYYYNTFRKLWGKYGFKDGFNLEGEKSWFAKEYIGIDKGIGMLMIENYLNETIWKYFMKNEYVIKGLEILELNPLYAVRSLK